MRGGVDTPDTNGIGEFLRWLVSLHDQAGAPSLRVLERRVAKAHGSLSKSTIGKMLALGRSAEAPPTLPPLDNVIAFVRALECGEERVVEARRRWLRVRQTLTAARENADGGEHRAGPHAPEPDGSAQGEPAPAPAAGASADAPAAKASAAVPPTPAEARWRKLLVACAFALVAILVLAVATHVLRPTSDKRHHAQANGSPLPGTSAATPASGHLDDDRGTGPIRYTVRYEDPGYELVLPAGLTLTDRQHQGLVDFLMPARAGREDPDTLYAELRAEGAADPRYLNLRITLEGRGEQTIHIDDIHPVDVHRTKPLDGTFIFIPEQGGGPISTMAFDFDETDPRARDAVSDGEYSKPGGLYFANHSLTIDPGEEDDILLDSMTTRMAASFDIAVDYRMNGRAERLVIDDHGHPFNVTPANCTRHSISIPGEGLVSDGQAGYRSVWEWDDFNEPIRQVADPAHYKLSFPYC